ncbi:MAG: hypothetical protein N2643_04450 [Endomicrobia bacterium]|nr:hypothetical protein [Endomicrobiia bacterium]
MRVLFEIFINKFFLIILFSFIIGIIISKFKFRYLNIFVLIIIIGSFQGILSLLFNIREELVIFKYSLICFFYIFALPKFFSTKLKVNINLIFFILLYLVLLVFFVVNIISTSNSDQIKPYVIQELISTWSILNIPITIFIVCGLDNIDVVYKFLSIVIKVGFFSSILGIIQFFLGPDVMYKLGIDIYQIKHIFIKGDNITFFRIFSIFPSHYEFGSFLILSMLSQIVLSLYKGKKFTILFSILYTVQILALGLTLNLTLLLTFEFIKFMLLLLPTRLGLQSMKQIIWRTILLDFLLILLSFLLFPTLRLRFLGIFYDSAEYTTALSSLRYRLFIVPQIAKYILENPLGYGVKVFDLVQNARINYGIHLTSDVFFLWLIFVGGIFLFAVYFFLLLYPLTISYRSIKYVSMKYRPLFYVIWYWLFVGIIIGGVSNSAVLLGTPTNVIVFAAIGMLYKIADVIKKEKECELYKKNLAG